MFYPEDIQKIEFDTIFVAVDDNKVKQQLIDNYKIPEEKVNTEKYLNGVAATVRVRSLEHLKEIFEDYSVHGSMAEVGVYQGDFAKHMNRIFHRTLYLYDTFEGFADSDLEKEAKDSEMRKYKHYAETSEELVLKKMINPEKCVICKGLFPDTAQGENDEYSFVNLDADLYAPILSGLEYFYPKLANGGVIFVHDYFNPGCPGVKKAVNEFVSKSGTSFIPLGDYLTVAFIKPLCCSATPLQE